MKVTIGETDKDFKPIQLEITIESRDELLDLYHRVNAAHLDIYSSSCAYTKHVKSADFPKEKGCSALYQCISRQLRSMGEIR